MVKKEVFIVIVAILVIQSEALRGPSEDDLNFVTEFQEEVGENNVDEGITIQVRASNCKDRGLPQKMSKDRNCKRLKASCNKLKSKCNGKLRSSLGKSASSKKCLKKLSSSEKNTKVKSYCNKSCKECVDGKWCPWTAWGHCSETCGDGTKTRTRSCGCPPPKGVGSPCLGATLQNSPCLETTCPLPSVYEEKDNTWLSSNDAQPECQLTGSMIMPVPDGMGLDGCKEECNKKTECDAIEYAETAVSSGTDCCFLVDCGGTVPEPLNTQAPHHGGTWTYKGYVKLTNSTPTTATETPTTKITTTTTAKPQPPCKDKKLPSGIKCGLTCPKLASKNQCSKQWKAVKPKKCVKKIKSWQKNQKVSKTCPKSCKICEEIVNRWGTWGQWSSCSASCEFGTKRRTRKCQQPPCSGRSSETKTCSEQPVCACGKAPGRIVGGGPVAKNSIPWQVGMVFWGYVGPSCGGTLISPKHVLTAAHCYDGYINFDMVVGDHHKYDPDGETVHKVCRVAYHPKYDEATAFDYDFAVVTLKEPVDFNSKVAPACLADVSMTGEKLVGKKAVVSGWGRLDETGGSPDVLHKVEVPVITSQKCDQDYSDTWYDITSAMICAGETNGQIDACQGDSGGPMTYEKGGKTYLIGVVSWGIGCARPGRPGVYARVSHAKDWIIDQMTKTC